MNTSAVFDALYRSLAEARAKIRIDGKTEIAQAVCSGIGVSREPTEQGVMRAIDDTVRLKVADLVAAAPGKCEIGDTIEVSVNGGEWVKAKIMGRQPTGGVLALTLGAQYG